LSASERRLATDPEQPDAITIAAAARWIARGAIVAFPTDTFYGFGVDAGNEAAARAVFDLKGRDLTNAMPLIAGSIEQVEELCGGLHGRSAELARRYWPGPLSLVVDAPSWVAPAVHGGRATVAVRVPRHALARQLALAVGRPITATSANRSGRPPAATADDLGWLASEMHVLVVDGGRSPGGAPSTLIDARGDVMRCLRDGAIPFDRVLTSG
jgi:L-threonylcarbamoyladenylate synthase